ncbi:MAG: hypothetical protein WB566_12915 [Terriglobales bacterium]
MKHAVIRQAKSKPDKEALKCILCQDVDMPDDFMPELDDQICEDCQELREQQATRGELQCSNCREDMPDDFNPEVDDPVCDDCHWALIRMDEE